MRKATIAAAFAIFIILASRPVSAAGPEGDVVYLKSGGSIAGIVLKEGKGAVEIETEGGSVVVSRAQIARIERAPSQALEALRADWEESRSALKAHAKESEAEREKRFKEYGEWVEEARRKKEASELGENEVPILRDPDSKSIVLETVLNGDTNAMLILDTGAAITVLSKEVGRRLGVDVMTDKGNDVGELHLAGGKTVRARMAILKSLRVGGIEERGVAAAVLLEDDGRLGFKDGLLGRSFLGRFNINIDMQKMKMTLQRLNNPGR